MSKNRQNQNTTQPPVEDKVVEKVENTEQGNHDQNAEKFLGEPNKEAREEYTGSINLDEKKGPAEYPEVGELPANPNGEGTGGELKDEAAVDLAADGLQLSVFQTRMAWIAANGTTHEQYVKNAMEQYVKVCTASIDLDRIAVEQKRLWRLLGYIHAHPAEFRKLFTIVIEFAKEYDDELFNLHMFFRAQEGLSLDRNEMQCFSNLRTLILNTIQSTNKARVKALIDIRKIVENDLIPENVRGQYVAFYE
jgi:hypothetical protein